MVQTTDVIRRMGMKGSALALAVWLTVTAAPASATVVDVTFQSTDGTGNLSGSFSYDTGQAPFGLDVLPNEFSTAAFHGASPLEITYNGTSYSFDNYSISTTDGSPGGGGDFFVVDYDKITQQGGQQTALDTELELEDPTGQSVTGTVLPTSFNSSSGHYTANVYVTGPGLQYQHPYGGGGDVSVAFSTVSPTPELPAWASMLLGLGLVGSLAWWQRGRWKPDELAPSFA